MSRLLFDIGCNVGRYALKNESLYDAIVCVDANAEMCKKAQENVKLKKCKFVNALITAETKQAVSFFINTKADSISTASTDWIKFSRFAYDYQNDWIETKNVPQQSIDDLVKQYGAPTYIKIDVEGYEFNVLQSMSKRYCPIAFEWAEEQLDDILSILAYLDRIGFVGFHVQAEDVYDYIPKDDSYEVYATFLKNFIPTLSKTRKEKWGMIHCI